MTELGQIRPLGEKGNKIKKTKGVNEGVIGEGGS